MKVISAPTIQEKHQYIHAQDTIARINKLLVDPTYAAQPDDNPKNPWVTHQQGLIGNISRFDAMGLQLLSLIEDGTIKNPMPAEIKLLAQRFLENSVGNSKLNSFLRQEAIRQSSFFKNSYIKPLSTILICDFTFKTRNFGQGESVQKLHRLHNSLISSNPVPDQDKLSLKTLSVALDLTKIRILKRPYIRNLIMGSKKLENIYTSSNESRKIFVHMEQESNTEVQKLGSGVLVLNDTRKVVDLQSKNLRLRSVLRMHFITRYHHAAMLDPRKGKVGVAEITISRGFRPGKFDLWDQLSSDMYKIDPVALIPKEHHQLLKQVYGENWQSEVASKFKIIENELYTNGTARFGGQVAGVPELENAAGIASLIPFGHKKLEPNDFEELHQDVITRKKYSKDSGMLCSSFCAISIATSLVELDKQIKQDINISPLKPDPKKIDALNIVTIPFGKHEDLYKIHPQRLLGILKSYNCVEPVQLRVVEHYIKEASRVSQAAKKHVVPTAAVSQEKATDRLLHQKKTVIQSRL